jgi:membrane-associated protease RseP (regulator of RpoE activity)
VSGNLPEIMPQSPPWEKMPAYSYESLDEPGPPLREWIISAVLFCLTCFTISFAGMFYVVRDFDFFRAFIAVIFKPSLLLYGLPFSFPLIIILLAHELGHFIVCRYYGMRCTPPFFIPLPIPPAGTFGAFIKIKSSFRNKRALFDIGIAGPLAGFIFTIPALWTGITLSKLIPKGALHHGYTFGEPLLFRLIGRIVLGYSPGRQEMSADLIAIAGLFGLLVTSLNLLPIWQLDGGHIAYAIIGRSRQQKLSIIAAIALILQSFRGWPEIAYSHIVFGLILLIIGARLRFYHPPTLQEEEKLGPGRLFLGFLALLILILSFTPVPIAIT